VGRECIIDFANVAALPQASFSEGTPDFEYARRVTAGIKRMRRATPTCGLDADLPGLPYTHI
jgi:hypothetical protein